MLSVDEMLTASESCVSKIRSVKFHLNLFRLRFL
jgi:hypothetical protein